jgi:hypothetical protein
MGKNALSTDARPRRTVLDDEPAAAAGFATAMATYKDQSGGMFPTWSEVLEVLQELGYKKAGDGQCQPTVVRLPFGVRGELGGSHGWEIRSALSRLGGVLLKPPTGGVYGFASESRRDAVLDAVRRRYGWTSVERN